MKRLGVVCGLLLAVAGVGSAGAQTFTPAKSLTPMEQSAITAEKSFIDVMKKGDRKVLKSTLADDFSYVGIDGQLAQGQDAIDELGGGEVNLSPYNVKVVGVTDSVAIVTYDVVVKVPPVQDQGPPPRYQHISSVWSKAGDGWKLKFQQTTAAHWGDW